MNPAHIILLSPLIWLSGFTPVIYQLFTAWIGLRRSNLFTRLGGVEMTLLGYIGVYTFSLFLAVLQGAEITRVLAGFYNLSFWMMGFFLIVGQRQSNSRAIGRSAFTLLCFILLITWAFAFIPGVAPAYPTLISSLIDVGNLPNNIRDNTTLNISVQNWADFGSGYRFSILSPYPTAFAILIFLLTCLSWPERWSRLRSLRILIIPALSFHVILNMTASRAVAGAFVVYIALLLYAAIIARIKGSNNRRTLTLLVTMFTVVLLMITLPVLNDVWERINESRAGSSALRFRIYEISLSSMINEHPLLGFGVKARDESIAAIPIGSHSTIISTLYKTGIIGFIFLLSFFVLVARRAIAILLSGPATSHDRSMAAGILAFFIALAFEDIDALPLASFLYFTLMALVLRRSEELELEKQLTSFH
ncbi:O-antigen ligase family protein [Thalassospira xianhensis]|uniref:O-antigen ligase-related domain-containing protein n=1 Tax=Thalassospira xianhensis MCCC 1A02616 TaxID=1177929 RepID=A0A367U6U0_9PROT|nr:O-antigen ligase family protein [Thalassospira xianhensis]RCK03948.1 hypothetical protein TH5_22725 [Thalassospira xianhensis MCCC 1A02616]